MAATGQAVPAGIERSPARAESAADGNSAGSPVFAQGAKSRATSPPDWLRRIHPATWLLAVFLLFLPAFANDFMQLQVFGWAFVLGMIALSLMFLAGYGGMVSLVQMTVAACAGYMYAIFGHSAFMEISLGWPWWATIPVALIVAVIFGTVSGALAVRTEGIYTIMITLAIASAFFYFTRQNYIIFNGFNGFNAVKPPPLFGVDWKQATPFYYLSLFFATVSFFVVLYVSRSSFGLALQGVRDNARRMEALGFNVTAHRIAAYSFAAVIAGVAGILLAWLNGQISPGTAGVGPVIDILIIAVVGGLRHPIGPFIGAFSGAAMAERVRRRHETAVLRIRGLHVYYGQSHALQGVDLDLPHGVVAVVGRNGMGKTTLCNAITGLVPVARGSIQFEGDELAGMNPSRIAHHGVGYVPQGRRLWASLTVDEHLRLCERGACGAWTRERIYDAFPRLAQRRTNRGGQLSGGEQQMLAISRAMLLNPRLLVMDEPTEGLAPVIVQQVEDMLIRIGEEGEISVLVIEQNIGVATAVSDDVAIMVNGRIHRIMDAAALAADRELQQRLLGVGRHGREDLEPDDAPATGAPKPTQVRLVSGRGASRVWMSNREPPTRWSKPVPVASFESASAELAGDRRVREADGRDLRTRAPYVGACGALDMVNFGPRDTVPERYRYRNLYTHNPQVTLMRTTAEENDRMGRWIGERLNRMDGPVRFLLPEGGVSQLDAPGQAFHDAAADATLFRALEETVRRTGTRQLVRVAHHINDSAFSDALVDAFESVAGARTPRMRAGNRARSTQ